MHASSKILVSLSLLFSSLASAHPVRSDLDFTLNKSSYLQSVQIVNLLANNNLTNAGMTTTSILVKYFNGSNQACWVATLYYQDDYTIHAGPTQGCREKVNRVEITPLLSFEKLQTYQATVNVPLDPAKYAYQITVIQDQEPLFDRRSGLIEKSGTIQTKIQAQ